MSNTKYIDTSAGPARWIDGNDVLSENAKVQTDPTNRVAIPAASGQPSIFRFTGRPLTVCIIDADALGFGTTPQLASQVGAATVGAQASPSQVVTQEGAVFLFDVDNFTTTQETEIVFVPSGDGHVYARILLAVE